MSKESGGFAVASGSETQWKGRQPKVYRTRNSFADFVARAKANKNGRAHLQRHHGGHGL